MRILVGHFDDLGMHTHTLSARTSREFCIVFAILFDSFCLCNAWFHKFSFFGRVSAPR